jgi:hypothetical protein
MRRIHVMALSGGRDSGDLADAREANNGLHASTRALDVARDVATVAKELGL